MFSDQTKELDQLSSSSQGYQNHASHLDIATIVGETVSEKNFH